MKKTLMIILLFFTTIAISAQMVSKDSLEFVGLNYLTGQKIYAPEYEFKNLIYDTQLDTTFNTLTLQLRDVKSNGKYYKNSGQLAVFDLASKEIKWSFDINYMNTEIEQYENVLLHKVRIGSTSRIDLASGAKFWNSKVAVYVTIPNLNIGLGYAYNSFLQEFSNNLSCIDLSTGATLWERKIDRSFGWNGVENINDTALIIKAAGLHFVNLKNGNGWDYDVKCGIKDYSKTVGANVAGVALGILTGSFVIATGHDVIGNLVSNLLSDSTCIYFASKEYLTCLTHYGKVLWRTELPKETSHSNIMMDSAKIYLINDGEALYNGRKYAYGKAYYAAYDKITGAEQYLSLIGADKSPLIEFITEKDSISLIFKDKIVEFSTETGISKTSKFPTEQFGSIDYDIARHGVFIKTDSVFQSLHDYDPLAFYVKTNKSKVLKLDRYLHVEKEINMDDLCILKIRNENFSIVYHNDKALILNRQNKAIAELNTGRKFFVYKNSLFSINKNTITEIDLKEMLN